MLVKIKTWLAANKTDLFLICIIVLVALISFAFGRISALREQKFPIQLQTANLASPEIAKKDQAIHEGDNRIVGSKSGTVYHLENCSGAKRIKEENKIYFSSAEEAEKAGNRPAANCPGL